MLTPQELAIISKLSEVWNELRALDEYHGSDGIECAAHIHALQEKIMARAAVRAHPDIFKMPAKRVVSPCVVCGKMNCNEHVAF